MSKSKNIIAQKMEYYRSFKIELQHKQRTASSLGFKTEVEKLENDIQWCKEIIELLNEVGSQSIPS